MRFITTIEDDFDIKSDLFTAALKLEIDGTPSTIRQSSTDSVTYLMRNESVEVCRVPRLLKLHVQIKDTKLQL